MTEQDLVDYALKCIRGEEPVYELAHKIAAARGVSLVKAMFGDKAKEAARIHLKQAEYAASGGTPL
jgi:hypothetical protein